MKYGYVCSRILDYVNHPSAEEAKQLFSLLRNCDANFIREINYSLSRDDVDGELPYEQEYCNKFVGCICANTKYFVTVSAYACNCLFDAVKTKDGWETSPYWIL